MDEQLYLGTRLGSCHNNSGSNSNTENESSVAPDDPVSITGWSGQLTGWSDDHLKVSPDRLVRSMCFLTNLRIKHRMVWWSLESITGWVSQERVFLWLSWVPYTGWSDGYLRKYHRMIRSSERSTARWFPEISVHRIIRCSLKNTHRIIRCSLENTHWKTQQGDYWKFLCIG